MHFKTLFLSSHLFIYVLPHSCVCRADSVEWRYFWKPFTLEWRKDVHLAYVFFNSTVCPLVHYVAMLSPSLKTSKAKNFECTCPLMRKTQANAVAKTNLVLFLYRGNENGIINANAKKSITCSEGLLLGKQGGGFAWRKGDGIIIKSIYGTTTMEATHTALLKPPYGFLFSINQFGSNVITLTGRGS